jgi:hypothetical protein
VKVIIAWIVASVRGVNGNIDDHAFLRQVGRKVLRQLKALFAVQFMRQRDLEIPSQLRVVRAVALVLAAFNGVE